MPNSASRQGAQPSETRSGKADPHAKHEPAPAPLADAGELASAFELVGPSAEAGAGSEPRPTPGPSTRQLMALQRAVGNRAVSGFVRSVAQRVPVSADTSETLYNQTNAGGQATARHYGGIKNYEITRQGDTGVTVTVKIKFLNQARNTVPPPPGAPAGTPRLGQLIGSPTEIPANDPRRAWATTTAASAVTHWNNRLTFVGEEWNLLSENTRKRLPVTFVSTPVFGLNEDAHNTVIVHGPSVTAGTAGHPIDAGNYYMNQGTAYPDSPDVIYAHEYGHLIGIPDEYSQSNAQMNALMHQAAPGGAASAMAALDRSTVERLVLAAMSRPLLAQLTAAMPSVAAAFTAQGELVKQRIATAARAAIVLPAVRDQLRSILTAEAAASVDPQVPGVVAFQTTRNFSNITRAAEGVAAAFSLASLTTQIGDAYWAALLAPHGQNVNVAGLGDVKINVQNVIYGTAGAGTPLAGNATALATSTVGPAAAAPGGAGGGGGAAAGGGPGLPAIAPPASLAGQLSALPATWAGAGSALETGVTADAFAAKLQAIFTAAAAAAAAPAPPGAAAAPALPVPAVGNTRQLYQRAYDLINNAARDAAQQLSADLVGGAIGPVLQTSVASLQTAIAAEVNNVMTMTPSALAAAGNPNPNMRAIVNGMKARLDAAKAATAGSGRDPLAGGGTAPAQDVTYSYQGLMGSNATTALRTDQFQPMLTQFNDRLKTFFERDFRAEVR